MVSNATQTWKHRSRRCILAATIVACSGYMTGCEVDSFFDPSKTGRFEFTPTLIPVLDRIDVIEQDDQSFDKATPVSQSDLIPGELEYVLFPGDVVTVNIFELYQTGVWQSTTRQVDAAGKYRVPELGDVGAAGLTVQEFEDEVNRRLHEEVIVNPQVDVVVEQGLGLRYTIYGFLQNPGVFNLMNPDLRLLDAFAIAGGIPVTTKNVYVIRHVKLSEDLEPTFLRPEGKRPTPDTSRDRRPPSVEDLIEQLEQGKKESDSPESLIDDSEVEHVDIDDLEPATTPKDSPQNLADLESAEMQTQPPVDIEHVLPSSLESEDGGQDTFIYIEERGEWVKVRRDKVARTASGDDETESLPRLAVERLIRVDYQRLARGDSSQNLVVRPTDLIYVDGPQQGNIYIDGEIARPGVYSLPASGQLTLSRLIAAAGGLGPIAVPERVDLTRKIVKDGKEYEATVRLDLAAIRHRTEPDVILKPDDHVIIGTSWAATPLAIIRNGFRATYGFGFLLDRNFGNDVFGAPPTNFRGQ